MLIPFTKMQGAGNDFVVLDETRTPLNLSREQYRFIANRRFGVGADQILSMRPATSPDVDFSYVIHNADGGMVEHCGNGARCFVRFVLEQGLTTKTSIRVQVQRGIITLHAQPDGQVTVDMGAPVFDAPALPFEPDGLAQHQQGQATLYTLLPLLPRAQGAQGTQPAAATAPQPTPVVAVSMGNPHVVLCVADTATAPVAELGAAIQALANFPSSVNVGFMQIITPQHIRLRVYERGVGETLACGTGACAAVVAGISQGLLAHKVQVDALGGTLHIGWAGDNAPVLMTGSATTVFQGQIKLPEPLPALPSIPFANS